MRFLLMRYSTTSPINSDDYLVGIPLSGESNQKTSDRLSGAICVLEIKGEEVLSHLPSVKMKTFAFLSERPVDSPRRIPTLLGFALSREETRGNMEFLATAFVRALLNSPRGHQIKAILDNLRPIQ